MQATVECVTYVEVAGALQALQFYGLASENKWAQLGYESTFFALFFFLAWCAGCCSVHEPASPLCCLWPPGVAIQVASL